MRKARWVRFTLGIAALALVLLAVAWMLAGSRWAEDRVARFIERRVSDVLAGQLRIGSLRGSIPGGDLRLVDVELVDAAGAVVGIDAMAVSFQPLSVASGRVEVDELTLEGLTVTLRETADGWNVARLLGPRDQPAGEPAIQALSIARIDVSDGVVRVERPGGASRDIDSLELHAALAYDGQAFTVDVDDGSLRDAATGTVIRELRAKVQRQAGTWLIDDFSAATALSRFSGRWSSAGPAQLNAEPLALRELEPLLGAPGPEPDAVATLAVTGSSADFEVEWTVQSDAGRAGGQWSGAWLNGQLTLEGTVQGQRLDLARLLQDDRFDRPVSTDGRVELSLPGARLDGATVAFDVTAPIVAFGGYQASGVVARGRWADDWVDVDASATAYSAAVTTTARWRPRDGSFQAHGRYRDLDVERLPPALGLPLADTTLAGAYAIDGDGNGWALQTTMEESLFEGARVAEGSTASLDARSQELTYTFDGAVDGVDLRRIAALASEPDADTVDGLVGGTLTLDASGTSLDELVATAHVTLRDSVVSGVTIDGLRGDVGITEGRLVVDAELSVRDVSDQAFWPDSPGFFTASGDAAVTASVDLGDGSGSPDWDDASGTARVMFGEGTVHGLVFDRLEADVGLDAGHITVSTFDVEGPQGRATSSGFVVVAGAGESDLDFTVQLDDLARLDPLAGQRLDGVLDVTGTLSGPPDELAATGRMLATDLKAGELEVQSLDVGQFVVTLRDRNVEQLSATATASATLLGWAGVPIDRADLVVGYANERFDVDAELAQAARRLGVTGTIDPLPRDRRLAVRRLDLAAEGVAWRLPTGGEALVAYRSDRLDVQGLELTDGESLVVIEGALGVEQPIDGSRLTLTAEHVRLEDVNRFLGGRQELSGRADATVVMTGALRQPDATLDVRVGAGSVDGVAFDGVVATAELLGRHLDIEGELEAGPSGRFSVRGTMPLVLGGETVDPLPAYDLRVQSAGINVGLLQPMMPELSDVAGLARVDLNISGPADEPEVGGLALLEDVTFRLPATGVTYRRMNGQLTIQRQDVVVHDLTFEDADGHAGRVQGGLEVAVDGPPTGFDLRITADGLHVLDNRDGEIAVNLEMQMMGDLRTPLLVGTVRVTRGVIEASDLLNRLSGVRNPPGYVPPGLTRDEAEGARDSLDRMSVSITLDLPSVLVRGRDLRTGGGPIGLGDVNVTVGGALSIAKETGEELDLVGRLDVTRGQYEFQGRTFNIQRGSGVQFRGSPTNPALDFLADRVISGVTAEVRLRGTMEEPEVSLSSRPPLDEGDILSLIVFGQAMNQLQVAERVSLAARAGAIAASAIANPITDSVARALDLDEFQFRPGEGVSGAGTLTIGRQLNDRLFVGFRHDFGSDDASQVSFEYRLNEYLHVLTSLAQGGDRSNGTQRAEAAGIDLIFRIRR